MIAYQHMFSDGSRITLALDLSGDAPRLTSVPPNAMKGRPRAIGDEYERWVAEVVIPDVLDRCSPKMLKHFARLGRSVTNKIK